jgi:hypothetical protein
LTRAALGVAILALVLAGCGSDPTTADDGPEYSRALAPHRSSDPPPRIRDRDAYQAAAPATLPAPPAPTAPPVSVPVPPVPGTYEPGRTSTLTPAHGDHPETTPAPTPERES